MDEGKILVVNLSKGLIGEDNAGILGSFLVTKIQLAAMSRSDIPDVKDRRPFYLYVDEFQNFATDSFATILSEARKYGLNLTVANQYISQMTETVRGAVFGNVGTMISFRVSAEDAQILAQQFEPQFEPGDLLQMHNRHFIINMVIKGEKAPAFSATTLNLPPAGVDNSEAIIANSRQFYARNRQDVEEAIDKIIQPPETLKKPAKAPSPKTQQSTHPRKMPVIPTATPNKPRIVREESPASNNTKKAPDIKNDGQLHPIRQIKTPPKKPPVSKDGVQIIQKKDEVILNLRGIDSSTAKANSTSSTSANTKKSVESQNASNSNKSQETTIKNKQPQDTKDSNLVKEPNTAAPKKRRRRRKRKPNQPNTTAESSSSKEQKTSSD